MTESLRVVLQGQDIGHIHLLNGDRTFFEFKDDYLTDLNPPILSQAYLDSTGHLIQSERSYQRKLPPWFSNLLPEGALRTYISDTWGVPNQREVLLLQKLGKDLPGAVEVYPNTDTISDQDFDDTQSESRMHFSLAGVQMKFPARLIEKGRLTVPADGTGGALDSKISFASLSGDSGK